MLGEDSAKHLIEALGPEATRDLDAELANLAQLGRLNAIQFQAQLSLAWIRQSDKEATRRYETLNSKLDQLIAAVEANHLDAIAFTAQAFGAFGVLRDAVRRLSTDERRDRRRRMTRLLGARRQHGPSVRTRSVAAD
jgi:hypothetical protein